MRKLLLALLIPISSTAGPYIGDYNAGDTLICGYFNTYRPSTGASFTLASGAVEVTKDNSATQDTDGLTLDNDFDAVTGRHQVCVDTSADGTFYSAGSRFSVYLSAGTVDSISVVGAEAFSFSLRDGSNDTAQDDLDVITGTTGVLLENDSITAAKIAADAIGATEIASAAIDADAIATDSIGAAEIADSSIDTGALAANAITAGDIAADAIGAPEIEAGAIGASEIGTAAIDADAIAADALGASEIATDAIGAAELADAIVIDADVEQVNGSDVCGDGSSLDKWSGCP